jgi:hypothetical protein
VASYLLRPDGDAAVQKWTVDPSGTAASVLDEAVTQPTAPTTGSDRITSGTNTQICQLHFASATPGPGETVTSAKLWVYIITPAGRDCQITITQTPSAVTPVTVPAGTAASWQSVTYTGGLTQAQIGALEAQIVNGTGTGTTEIDAAYIELTTVFNAGQMLLGVG